MIFSFNCKYQKMILNYMEIRADIIDINYANNYTWFLILINTIHFSLKILCKQNFLII